MSYDFLNGLPQLHLFAGLNRKAVTRINSMPTIGSHAQRQTENRLEGTVIQNQSSSPSPVPLEVGSIVEVESNSGVTVYGVVRWLGVPVGKTTEWAGIELVSWYGYVLMMVRRRGRLLIADFLVFRTMR